MALGARSADVMRHAITDSLPITIAGLAAGVMGALAISRLIAGFLFGICPVDAATYAAITLLLAVVVLFAGAPRGRRPLFVATGSKLRGVGPFRIDSQFFK
jgi:putative ABC transport system permease protein